MKKWYSARELAGLPGVPGTVQRVNKRAKREQWVSRPRKARGGGREYHLSSLPPETRAHLRGKRLVTLVLPEQSNANRLIRLLARWLRPVLAEALREMHK